MATESEEIQTLMLQIQGGILVLEEIMDRDLGGDWVSGRKGDSAAARYAWGQLSMAWINLGSMLLRDPGVEPWTIAPLISRTTQGETNILEYGPDRQLEIEAFKVTDLNLRETPREVLRVIHHPKEPRYTLDEARKILDVDGHQHHWVVDVDPDAEPIGVRCSVDGCEQQRPVQEGGA